MAITSHSPSANPPRIADHCTGCGRCVAACRFGALSLETERPSGFGRKRAAVAAHRCTSCMECLPACPYQALFVSELKDPKNTR